MIEHLSWAHSIAAGVARSLPTWFTVDDLIGPAEVALVQCAAKFDPSTGCSFVAFAQRRIHGACIDSIRRREYRERSHGSLDVESDPGSNPKESPAGSWQRWAEDQGPAAAEQSADDLIAADRSDFLAHVWLLPPRHQKVIALHYLRGFSLREIAGMMRLGCPRISRIHRQALEMLRPAAEAMR